VTFSPELESLDDRIVPANLLWTDAAQDEQFGNPADWLNRDTLQPVTSAPVAGDNIYFDGNYFATHPWLNPNCINLFGASSEYGSINLINSYAGNVSTPTGFQTAILDLESGSLDQLSSTADITVNQNFNFTGGTLNSTSNLANLIISGSNATATFNPNGRTVNLGDNISLQNGAVATMNAGTINITNDNEQFNINQFCGLKVAPGGNLVASEGIRFNNSIDIAANAWLEVVSGTFEAGGLIENDGGSFTLDSDTKAYVPGLNRLPGGWQYYTQNSGVTRLFGGSTLQTNPLARAYVAFHGGLLTTVANASGNSSATIDTPVFNFLGGDLFIDEADPNHHYGTLTVTGSVNWLGGTYHPFVAGDGVQSDQWYAKGTFTVNAGTVLSPAALDGEGNPIMPNANMRWAIIRADGGIPNPSPVPSYNTAIWTLDPVAGNPIREWDLTT
jgi:hypothetical protein